VISLAAPLENPRSDLGANAPRDLGVLSNACGGGHVQRWVGANGIEVVASDMGTVKRFAYQLGDRVYYVDEGGRVRAADIPCGAHAAFSVLAQGHTLLREHP